MLSTVGPARRAEFVIERVQRHGRELMQRAAGALSSLMWSVTGRRPTESFGILVYHRITEPVAGCRPPTMNVTPVGFRRQMQELVQRGYRVVPLTEMLARAAAGRPPAPRTVVLTFDDAFAGVYRHAWPVMRELGLPATVFLSTAYLGQCAPFPFDPWGRAHHGSAPQDAWRPLTHAECEELLASGLIELGAHTHTHADFRGRPRDFAADLQRNVEALQSEFGLERVSFAFPFGRPHLGYVSEGLIDAAQEVGVTCGLSTEAVPVSPHQSPFEWGRFNAYEWDTGATLAAKVSGWYGWAPRLQEWATRGVVAERRRNRRAVGTQAVTPVPASAGDAAEQDSLRSRA